MSDIRQAGGCPILTGENLNRRHGFWDLISQRAVDLVAPDFQKCGGLLEGKRIGELAELQGIRVAPHNIASPLGTVASAPMFARPCPTLWPWSFMEATSRSGTIWSDSRAVIGR